MTAVTREASAAMRAMVRRFADAVVEATAEVDPTAPCPPARRRDALLTNPVWVAWAEAMVRRIWPAPSQSAAALVDDFHDAVKCRSGVDDSKAALLAAIAAQEAATEAAQAEVVRLRQAVETVRDDMAIAAGLSQPPHVVEYAIVIKRLDAALKETP